MLRKLTDRARAAASRTLPDATAIAGACGVVYGVAQVYPPAAWIVGGAAACLAGLLFDRSDA